VAEVTAARETRLPSDAELGQDWYDVLEAVFSHVDNVLGRKQAGFNADEFAAMTEGQRAAWHLRWLRDFVESDGLASYFEQAGLVRHQRRLAEDARIVGAHPFIPILAAIGDLPADRMAAMPLSDEDWETLEQLESDLLAVEDEHGTLWHHLARYVRTARDEFFAPLANGPTAER
jgi:hypothetical protein